MSTRWPAQLAAVFACVAMVLPTAVYATTSPPLLANVALHGTHLGILVTELPSGRELYARNADDAFTPASTLKLLTGITALETLGRDAVFTSDLSLRGKVHGTRFDGDVIIQTGGDPLLSTHDLGQLLHTIVALGIHEIHGAIRIQSRISEPQAYPEGWLIADEPYEYAAPVPGIALDENAVHVAVSSASAGSQATIIADPFDVETLAHLGLKLKNDTSVGLNKSADTISPEWKPAAIGVSGAIPANFASDDVAIAVPDPAAFFGARMLVGLANLGITVLPADAAFAPTGQERLLWHHQSPPLADIVRTMWLRSDNVIAEMLLEQTGFALDAHADTRISALGRERALLQSIHISPDTVALADGSGLSRYNLATPRMFAQLLAHIWASDLKETVLASLPLSGTRGTLAHRFTDAPLAGAYYAKTGGMQHVANLTGFLHTKSGKWLTVTILADNALISDEDLRTIQTTLLNTYITF